MVINQHLFCTKIFLFLKPFDGDLEVNHSHPVIVYFVIYYYKIYTQFLDYFPTTV